MPMCTSGANNIAPQDYLTLKALHGHAPVYIKDMIKWYQPVRELRSSYKNLLVPSEFNIKSYGRRAFSVAGGHLFIKNSSSIDIFKRKLKAFLFKRTFCT